MNFRNPLNYRCAPNGCGPEVAIESSLKRFLAYGFVMCCDHLHGSGTEKLAPDSGDVYWLRKNFLETMGIAKEWVDMPEEERESGQYQGDQSEGSFTVALQEQPPGANPEEPVGVMYEWRCSYLNAASEDEPETLMIELAWMEPDYRWNQTTLWLESCALKGPKAQALLDKAEEMHGGLTTTPMDAFNEEQLAHMERSGQEIMDLLDS